VFTFLLIVFRGSRAFLDWQTRSPDIRLPFAENVIIIILPSTFKQKTRVRKQRLLRMTSTFTVRTALRRLRRSCKRAVNENP